MTAFRLAPTLTSASLMVVVAACSTPSSLGNGPTVSPEPATRSAPATPATHDVEDGVTALQHAQRPGYRELVSILSA